MHVRWHSIAGSLFYGSICVLIGLGAAAHADQSVQAAPDGGSAEAQPANDADALHKLGVVDVIAIAPQQGAELPQNLVPYNIQSATSADFGRGQVLDSTDYLNQRMSGVTIDSAQGNPLQPDLQFRGFTATPLLGGSEGISVYVDGVRVNELFGDTMNWDLIPEEAMSKISLLSGANPVFGRNTLGGTILIQTKTGFTDPGAQMEAYGGSFGRSEVTVETAGNDGTWGYYLLANRFDEDGWRDLSASRVGDFLGTLSWRGDRSEFDLHLSHAGSSLTGNGAQSAELLDVAPDSVFTAPDRTRNFYSGVSTQGRFKVDDATSLSATLFARQVDTRSYNGDATDFAACNDDSDVLCNDDGSRVLDQNGHPVSSDYDAINNIGVRKQRAYGASLQVVLKQPLFGRDNQFVIGLDVDRGRVNYSSVLEASTLVADASDPYSYVTASNTAVLVPDDALAVHIAETNAGLYLTDTLLLTDRLAMTFAGRYDTTHTTIEDRTGENPDLDGDHKFHRFNPSVGFTYGWAPAVNFYAGYSESTRAPTPVELTCASPDAPCKLPNDFVADPDLKQVVAKNIEAGLRGDLDAPAIGRLRWQFGLFSTTNHDDLLFQATGGAQSNEGFYANVGDTRRRGFELSLSGKAFDGRVLWYANETRLDATFRTPFEEISANDPAANSATRLVQVVKGDRIPGLPKNALKLGADCEVWSGLSVGAGLVYNSARFLRGDESNENGPLGGYTIVNLRMRYRFNGHLAIFARADNVFDRRYASFGMLGDASVVHPDTSDPRFLTPGEPRAGWFGITVDI